MRTGTCTSCGGTEVYAARNGLGLGQGHRVGIRPHIEPGFRGALVPHHTEDVWTYLCGSCGYTETYLHDAAAIDFVRQRWMRVTPPG